MEIVWRPAVRIICLDVDERVLLLRWRDPNDQRYLWEPPGGGIETDETPREAAGRELEEETGFDASAIGDTWVVVERDTVWRGRRFVGQEPFFLARFTTQRPMVSRDGLLPDEQRNLAGHAWFGPGELLALTEELQPPNLALVIGSLSTAGTWARDIPLPASDTD